MPQDESHLASELRVSIARLRRRMVAERDPDNPLSIAAMAVLGALERRGGLTVGELAEIEHVQPPSMTRILNGLRLAGCVVRAPHTSDGRSVLVSITDSGREQLLKDRRQREAWLDRRLRELSPDQRNVLALAAPILEALSLSKDG